MAVVATALTGVGVGVHQLVRDDGAGGAVAGQLRHTFPSAPRIGWSLDASEIYGDAVFVRPDGTSYQYLRPGFLDLDDVLVTAVVAPGTDSGATIVAVDAATGEVRWTNSDLGFHPVCATATVDGLLPCLGQEATFGPVDALPEVHFVDIADGSIDHSLTVAERIRAVEVAEGAVFTMGYDPRNDAYLMARGTPDDLTGTWSQSYGLRDGDGCVGSGDTSYDGVRGGVVFTGSDAGMVVANAADGTRLAAGQVVGLASLGPVGFTASACPDNDDPDVVTTVVADLDGTARWQIDAGAPAARPFLVDPSATLPVLVGDTAYDAGTGDTLWTAGTGDAVLRAVVGDTVLGRDADRDTVAWDLATGDELWSVGAGPDGYALVDSLAMSDGARVMLATDEGLLALDLATGRRMWQMPEIDDASSVAAAGTGFAHARDTAIDFYAPTGGPAGAPGRATASTDGVIDNGGGGVVTPCGTPPEMTPVNYRAQDGDLVVVMELRARCATGDVVASDRLRVAIRDPLGRIAESVFDFSDRPIVLRGEERTTVDLVFVRGSYLRHPSTLGDRIGAAPDGTEVVTRARASGDEIVDCIDEGSDEGSAASATSLPTAPPPLTTVLSVEAPGCGTENDAMAALRAQVDVDRRVVATSLADRWVAQLSSKRPGLVAPDVDGRMVTWTPCEILQQHLRLRGRYPEVRLVWSDEWRTFDLAGWWVTIAGLTFGGPDAANGWCDDRAIPTQECYAKVISDSRDSRGSTRYRR